MLICRFYFSGFTINFLLKWCGKGPQILKDLRPLCYPSIITTHAFRYCAGKKISTSGSRIRRCTWKIQRWDPIPLYHYHNKFDPQFLLLFFSDLKFLKQYGAAVRHPLDKRRGIAWHIISGIAPCTCICNACMDRTRTWYSLTSPHNPFTPKGYMLVGTPGILTSGDRARFINRDRTPIPKPDQERCLGIFIFLGLTLSTLRWSWGLNPEPGILQPCSPIPLPA